MNRAAIAILAAALAVTSCAPPEAARPLVRAERDHLRAWRPPASPTPRHEATPRAARDRKTIGKLVSSSPLTRPAGGVLACIRDAETVGGTAPGMREGLNGRWDYRSVSKLGPWFGGYQFDQPTWDGQAIRHAPHLVGVRPDRADPADQDRLAGFLYRSRGLQPWGMTARRACR